MTLSQIPPGSNQWQFDPNRQAIETTMSYDARGHMILSTSPSGHRVRYQWADDLGGPITNETGFPVLTEDATSYKDTDFAPSDFVLGVPSRSPSDPASGLNLTTRLAYDAYGNVKAVTDPLSHTVTTTFNALDLITQVQGPAPFGYSSYRDYDGKNSPVRVQRDDIVANDLNDNGVQDGAAEQTFGKALDDQGNHRFSNFFHYDDANDLVLADLDATDPFSGARVSLKTRFQRDGMERVIAVQEPEGNVHSTTYDERGLVFETVAGASDPLTSQKTRVDYDANGNVSKVYRDDGLNTVARQTDYDLVADRATKTTDSVGNFSQVAYDAAGNVVESWRVGDLGQATKSVPTVLSHAVFQIDEAGRLNEVDRQFFEPATGATLTRSPNALALPPFSNLVTPTHVTPSTLPSVANPPTNAPLVSSVMQLDPSGKVLAAADDNAHVIRAQFDLAERPTIVTDQLGDQLERVYDDASRVIRLIERECRSDQPGVVVGTFNTELVYDEEDRLVTRVSQMGNTTRWLYDSRHNVTQVSDAQAPLTGGTLAGNYPGSPHQNSPIGAMLNGRGNTTRFVHDGLSRPIETHRDLRAGGNGSGSVTSQIVTKTAYDGNSRVVARTDDNLNVTKYCYDDQNRLIETHLASGKTEKLVWVDNEGPRNRTSTVKAVIDARNVVTKYSYDPELRRISSQVISAPPGAGQTIQAHWRWDGADRMTFGANGTVLGVDDNSSIGLSYDSLSDVIGEDETVTTLKGAVSFHVGCDYDGVGNKLAIHYPQCTSGAVSGPATGALSQSFDELDRLSSVNDGGSTPIVAYTHVGMGDRRLQRSYRTNATLSCSYDDNRRPLTYNHDLPAGQLHYQLGWDRVSNRIFEIEGRSFGQLGQPASNTKKAYQYDSVYRLMADVRNSPDLSMDANNGVAASLPTTGNRTTYDLDGANNRKTVTADGALTNYLRLPGDPLRDSEMNQYTTISSSAGSANVTHDAAGNQLSSSELGEQRFFDARERLVQITSATKGTDTRYRYDVLGRRVSKYSATGSFDETVYVRDGWETLEEHKPTGSGGTKLLRRFVYGEGVDEPLRVTLPDYADVNRNGNTTEYVNLWYHENSIGSIVAMSDDTGHVVESYRYTAYGLLEEVRDKDGNVPVDADGNAFNETQVKQPFAFQGRRRDFEEAASPQSALLYFRARFYSSQLGRFVSRDPKGVWGDASQMGNAASAFGNNPVNEIDPFGEGAPGAESNAEVLTPQRTEAERAARQAAEAKAAAARAESQALHERAHRLRALDEEVEKRCSPELKALRDARRRVLRDDDALTDLQQAHMLGAGSLRAGGEVAAVGTAAEVAVAAAVALVYYTGGRILGFLKTLIREGAEPRPAPKPREEACPPRTPNGNVRRDAGFADFSRNRRSRGAKKTRKEGYADKGGHPERTKANEAAEGRSAHEEHFKKEADKQAADAADTERRARQGAGKGGLSEDEYWEKYGEAPPKESQPDRIYDPEKKK